MWKKGFSTVACMGTSYEEVIESCVKHSITGVEIRLEDDGSVFGKSSKEDLEQLSKAFRDNGLVITNLGSSVCFTGYDEEKIEEGRAVADTAALLGVKAFRVFLGHFAAMVNPDKPQPDYDGIVKALCELCDYAKEKNVEIWVETHNEFATGKVLQKLLSDVDKSNLKIIWDVIHPIEDGEAIVQTWDYIGDYVSHIHIKDGFDRKDPLWHDYKYTKLGEGELPLKELLKLLEEKNYMGYVSLEWERAWRDEIKEYPDSLDFIFQMFNEFAEVEEAK